jgi:hypothetical protein
LLIRDRRRARLVFAKRPDREELIADAISVAWELVQTAPPEATPQSIASSGPPPPPSGTCPPWTAVWCWTAG